MRKLLLASTAALLMSGSLAIADDSSTPSGDRDMQAVGAYAGLPAVHDVIDSDTQFRLFVAALKQTPLWNMLQQEQSVTLFLPTDQALRHEGSAFLLEHVLITPSNQERLQEVLSYHVYPGVQLDREAVRDANLHSLRGACFPLYRSGSGLRIGPEAVVTKHITADNGGIFVIDRLLWRPWDGSSHCAGPRDASAPMLSRLPRQ
jgi:uncharacterized surface protein with fasciclin (FAS1) repeats